MSAVASVIHLVVTAIEATSQKDLQGWETLGEAALAIRDLLLAGRHAYNAYHSYSPKDNVLYLLALAHLSRMVAVAGETILENLGKNQQCNAARFGIGVLFTSLIYPFKMKTPD